ncbi:hypothetical protein FRC04_001838 [Tulasnella sp. 424]|nr:hypothetical protein FRC04_001838 [Tulasnella sp. 424]
MKDKGPCCRFRATRLILPEGQYALRPILKLIVSTLDVTALSNVTHNEIEAGPIARLPSTSATSSVLGFVVVSSSVLPRMSALVLGSPGFIFWDLRGKNRRDEELGRETIQPVTNAAGSAIDFGGSLVNNLTPYFDFDISSTIKVAERDAAVAGTPVQWITSISKSALEKNEDGSF